jgi:mono/diheme cytochrome c family protein
LLTIVLLVAVLACGESPKKPASTATRPRTSPRSVRITMDALHQLGGVPSGWQLTPLPGDAEAGRRLFQKVGCASCHKVAGEPSGESTGGESGPGPELTGMGNHHPPAYFLEAILNPDAVLVDGPGYVSAQGHSAMPTYPDLTVTQLEDLVAYLSSLTAGDPHAAHQMPPVQMLGAPGVRSAPPNPADLPLPPETAARAYFVQSYDVVPGKVQAFARTRTGRSTPCPPRTRWRARAASGWSWSSSSSLRIPQPRPTRARRGRSATSRSRESRRRTPRRRRDSARGSARATRPPLRSRRGTT